MIYTSLKPDICLELYFYPYVSWISLLEYPFAPETQDVKTSLFCLFYECHDCHPMAQAKNLAFILFFSPLSLIIIILSVPKFCYDIAYLSLNFICC